MKTLTHQRKSKSTGADLVIEETQHEVEINGYGKHGGAEYRILAPGALADHNPWVAVTVTSMGGLSGSTIRVMPPGIYTPDQAEAVAAALELAHDYLNGDGQWTQPDVPPVELTPYSATIPEAGANNLTFAVHMTGPGLSGTWTVEKQSEATWLTLNSPTTPQAVDGNVTYQVNRNSGPPRTGYFYVNGKTFTVSQVAGLVEQESVPQEPVAMSASKRDWAAKR